MKISDRKWSGSSSNCELVHSLSILIATGGNFVACITAMRRFAGYSLWSDTASDKFRKPVLAVALPQRGAAKCVKRPMAHRGHVGSAPGKSTVRTSSDGSNDRCFRWPPPLGAMIAHPPKRRRLNPFFLATASGSSLDLQRTRSAVTGSGITAAQSEAVTF